MLIRRDLNTHAQVQALTYGDDPAVTVGTATLQYEVKRYVDTRNLAEKPSYLVSCSLRVVLGSGHAYSVVPGNVLSYADYPVLFSLNASVGSSADLPTPILVDYFPRTLNSSVNMNETAGQSSSSAQTRQHTTGSSQAQTNTHGLSGSIGFMGSSPMGSLGYESSSSSTSETSRSSSSSKSMEQGSQLSNTTAMSIKDWGSYAEVDANNGTASWVWGQEFPWNVIQLNDVDKTGVATLPEYVQGLLYEGNQLFPPSELSLFGVDVVMKATWQVAAVPGTAGDQAVQFTHAFDYTTATHKLLPAIAPAPPALQASLRNAGVFSFTSDTLDLPLLALDPLNVDPAVIGFLPRHFDIEPATGAGFAITSVTNDLLVRGSGFDDTMTTDFTAGTPEMTVFFKSTEPNSSVSLAMKHWVTGLDGCWLRVNVNGVDLPPRTVTLPEEGTGEDNVTRISLRFKDYTSNDYCDYLGYGLNVIKLSLAPTTSGQTGTYRLLTMAIA